MPALNEKQILRARYRQLRAAITDREEKEAALTKALLAHPAFLAADQVLCYVSFGTEPGTYDFLNMCFHLGKAVAVPQCEANGVMRFVRIDDLSTLCPAPPYGIPEPAGGEQAAASERTLCVVPGLAFDRKGYRLGYGGGYYDRFLRSFPGRSLGLCFAECLTDVLPHTAHDMAVGAVLTPEGTF